MLRLIENGWSSRGEVANGLDCENKLQLHYYVPFRTNIFGKGISLYVPSDIGSMFSSLFFYKDDFDIK